jgi:hypothetical protein
MIISLVGSGNANRVKGDQEKFPYFRSVDERGRNYK